MKVYLDANILSRFTDYPRPNLSDEDKQAIGLLAEDDRIDFVTSRKALEEFQRSQDPDRRDILKLLYRLMSKIPSTDLFEVSLYGQGLYGQGTYGGSPDNLYVQLRAFFDDGDAQHIFQAIKGHCNYFLTLDDRTILQRVRAHEKEVTALAGGIRFGTPAQLAGEIDRGTAPEPIVG
jgi:predicted nucleic acid-binding protein